MKNLHIAIDGNEANSLNRVGSNVYAYAILRELEQLLVQQPEISVTVLLSQPPVNDLPQERVGWQYQIITPQKFWTQWALPLHLFLNRATYSVFFTPGHYAPRLSPIPYVSSVMDTAYLIYPEQFKRSDTIKLTKWTEYSVAHAQKVIAISEFTKQEVERLYRKKPADIIVAYPSISLTQQTLSSPQKNAFFRKHRISEPYFLFVGTIQPRKNIETLISSFEIFCRMEAGRSLKKKKQSTKHRKNKKPKLIIAGKTGWLSEPILRRIAQSPNKNRIICTGFITDQEKATLYKHATATCLLGLYEGFGIPPLESLACNTIPIVSNTTSLPEVVGKAGIQVNPLDPQAVADALWYVSQLTKTEKKSFQKQAKIQLQKFNWLDSAHKILEAITTVAHKNK